MTYQGIKIHTTLYFDPMTLEYKADAYVMPIDGVIMRNIPRSVQEQVVLARTHSDKPEAHLVNDSIKLIHKQIRNHMEFLH